MRTTAGADGHTHVATIDDDGDGITSEAADGHWHAVEGCDVQRAGGHTHELTADRVSAEDDAPTRRPGRGQQGGAARREVA